MEAIERCEAKARELEGEIAERPEAHTDAPTFTSLPRAGRVRAAALLSELGDVRERFPHPESLAALAGAAPVTRVSGKHRSVSFRWACDGALRHAVMDFAGDSRHASPWAAGIYRRDRGCSHPHAMRILARAWPRVLWRCRHGRTPYAVAKNRGAVMPIAA